MSLIEEVFRSKGRYWKEQDMSMPTLEPYFSGGCWFVSSPARGEKIAEM